ncbi:transporter, major facilitator family protein [Aeromicrobium marinum DSM 15272]|uniref:Transporter, major facilitator family protein n=1 Tax=Aeromicrobium marinum DSM 15272 TaxID=585531 RepID=E2SBI9_9ACTN|nr:MFS transporter [Aeromicrobium marinum]EFQ83735.1 transporter, major facilitator family protein [Aeromicrobium marinum DSM 15272]
MAETYVPRVATAPTGPVQRWAYPTLLLLLGTALGVSTVPAPLYGVYMSEWGLAPVTTTVVFAAYAFAALAAVLFSGAITDRFGRKPVISVAVVGMLAGLAVFAAAPAVPDELRVPVLVLARVLHGASVGASVVAISAALLDLRPELGARTGHLTGIVFNIGVTLAILGAAVLAQYGPAPLVLPYGVIAVLVAGLGVALWRMEETHHGRGSVPLRVARPRIPAAITTDFTFSALGAMASWSVLGVFLSLFPTLAAESTGLRNLVFGGAVVAASSGAAVLSQIVAGQRTAAPMAVIGDVGTGLSLLLAVPALAIGNPWAVAVSAVLIGFFFGLAFGCSLRHLTNVVPGENRGEVMSAFYVCAYGAMAVPTILAGAAATRWGIADVFGPFVAVVALACLVAATLGFRILRRQRSPIANTLISS